MPGAPRPGGRGYGESRACRGEAFGTQLPSRNPRSVAECFAPTYPFSQYEVGRRMLLPYLSLLAIQGRLPDASPHLSLLAIQGRSTNAAPLPTMVALAG